MAGVNACVAFLVVSGGALFGFIVAAILAADKDEEEKK